FYEPRALARTRAGVAGGPATGRDHPRGASGGCVGSRRARSTASPCFELRGPRPSRRRAGGGAAHAGRVARPAPAAVSLGREPPRGTALVHRTGPPPAAPTASPRCRAARARTERTRARGSVYGVGR